MSEPAMSSGNGKRALFSAEARASAPATGRVGETGRRAVFSAPPRRRGTVVVECERCEARTPVPLVEMPLRLVPSLWIPWRTHSRLMRCPACEQPAWCRVHWRDAFQQ